MRVLCLAAALSLASLASGQSFLNQSVGWKQDVLLSSRGEINLHNATSLRPGIRSGVVIYGRSFANLDVGTGLAAGEQSYSPSMDDVMRPAMWLGTRMAVLGLATGVVYAVGGLIVDATTVGLNLGTVLAFGAIIGMPVIFGVAGFAAGALGGAVVVGVRVVF